MNKTDKTIQKESGILKRNNSSSSFFTQKLVLNEKGQKQTVRLQKNGQK